MTRTEDPPASAKTALAPNVETLDERSRRAWTEPMAVRRLKDGRYAVDSQSGATYVVDLPQGDCTCPDNEIRGALCKHIRRVAIEINERRVPPPELTTQCRACGREIGIDARSDPPYFCPACRLEPGDLVFDREHGPGVPLLVIGVTDRRADEVMIPERGATVAEYGENRGYDPADPVVEVIYPRSVRPGRTPQRYSFPLSRLAKPDDRGEQTTLESAMGG